MKKFLLSLFSLLAVAGMATANTATVTFKDLGYANAEDVTTVKVNDDITLLFDKGSNSNQSKYYNTGNAVRMYGGNTLEVNGAEGVTITEAVFTVGSSNKFNDASTVSAGAFDVATATWTGDANSFTLTNGGATGHARIESITFTYTGGTGGSTDPEPTDPEPSVTEVADIAAFLALENNSEATIKSDAVVVYQLGANLWIKDNSGWLLVYGQIDGANAPEYANGDVIKGGYTGKLSIYNNLPEMVNTTNFVKNGTTTAVEPTVVNTGDANGEPVNSYIKLTGCTITGSGRNYTADDGSGEIALYTNSTSFSVPTGSGFTVYAFVSVYKETIQLTPVEITTDSGREIVSTPTFSVAEGMVDAGTKVAIKCATEGATIYYTVDGTNPNAESAVYAEEIEINETTTIKALAVKEGCDDSDIASITYTVFVPTANDAMFNFADPSTLSVKFADEDFEDDGTTGNTLVNVQDVEFTEKGVSVKAVSTVEGTTGTPARLYHQGSTGVYSFRVYNKSSVVISAPEANPITKVIFNYYNGKTSYEKMTAPAEGTWNAGEWTAPEGGVNEVAFVCTGTQQIKNITVSCKDELSGVENVTVENEDAPVEYFNLQGVRVQNPENGLFIRRQGNKVSKVIIR